MRIWLQKDFEAHVCFDGRAMRPYVFNNMKVLRMQSFWVKDREHLNVKATSYSKLLGSAFGGGLLPLKGPLIRQGSPSNVFFECCFDLFGEGAFL
jgi:hypothetical protein